MAIASEPDLRQFINRQRSFLTRERGAEIERSSLLLSNCSHKLLEQKGLALGGLGVVSVEIGLGGKSLIELERPSAYHTSPVFPPHTLRPGDLARIDQHISIASSGKKSAKPKVAPNEEGRTVDGVVYKVSDTRIVLATDPSSTSNEELDIPERCRLLKLANTVTYDRMDRAMDHLERLVLPNDSASTLAETAPQRSSAGPNSLHRVLLGLSTPDNRPSKSDPLSNLFFDSSLNPSQVAAVRFALRAPEVACIHGPPGTGKTRVLVEVIRQLVFSPCQASNKPDNDEQSRLNKPLKILVCGASNLAVDNLLERLSVPTPVPMPIRTEEKCLDDQNEEIPLASQRQFPSIMLTRLGHPARVLSSLHSRTLDAQAQASDEAALVNDVKNELEEIMGALTGKVSKGASSNATSKMTRGAKTSGASARMPRRTTAKKGQRLRGEERKKAWQSVRDLRKEYRKREGGVVKSVLSKAEVVLATCHGAGSRQLYNSEFDVVIIDEATQALEAVCWVPILKAKKLILAGDPMQLGPTIISEGNRRHEKLEQKRQLRIGKQASGNTSSVKVGSKPSVSVLTGGQLHIADESASERDNTSNSESSPSDQHPDVEDSRPQAEVASIKQKSKSSVARALLRPPRSLGTTVFDRLEDMYGGQVKRMLDIQYRMNTKIAAFPSKTLYQSRLSSHSSNASRLLRDLPGVSQEEEYDDVVGEGSELIFWDTAGAEFWERSGNEGETSSPRISGDDGGSLCNENEAVVVKRWVDRLVAAGVQPAQIAIITPYQAQSQILSSMLSDSKLEIGTADGMQGREKEAVVLSLVRSNPEGEVGFLKEKRRLNVAMTRAKRQLCVVGDSSTIRRGGGSYLKKWMTWLEAEADVRFAGDG